MRYVCKNPPGGERNPYQLIDYMTSYLNYIIAMLLPLFAWRGSYNIWQLGSK